MTYATDPQGGTDRKTLPAALPLPDSGLDHPDRLFRPVAQASS